MYLYYDAADQRPSHPQSTRYVNSTEYVVIIYPEYTFSAPGARPDHSSKYFNLGPTGYQCILLLHASSTAVLTYGEIVEDDSEGNQFDKIEWAIIYVV
jgi:hypothetical protein